MAENIVKLRVDGKDFDQNIKSARQGLLAMEDACRKVGGTLEVVEKDELDFVKAMGEMETTAKTSKGQLREMTEAINDLSLMYKRLTDEEKNSPFGKALAQSMDQLKGRASEIKDQMDDLNQELSHLASDTGFTDGMRNMTGVIGSCASAVVAFTGDSKELDVVIKDLAKIQTTVNAVEQLTKAFQKQNLVMLKNPYVLAATAAATLAIAIGKLIQKHQQEITTADGVIMKNGEMARSYDNTTTAIKNTINEKIRLANLDKTTAEQQLANAKIGAEAAREEYRKKKEAWVQAKREREEAEAAVKSAQEQIRKGAAASVMTEARGNLVKARSKEDRAYGAMQSALKQKDVWATKQSNAQFDLNHAGKGVTAPEQQVVTPKVTVKPDVEVEEITYAEDSIAGLTAKIKEYRDAQQQATNNDDWQTLEGKIKDAQNQIDQITGKAWEVKLPDEKDFSTASTGNFSSFASDLQQQMATVDVTTPLYQNLQEQLADTTNLQTIVKTAFENGFNFEDLNIDVEGLWGKILNGEDIQNMDWETIIATLNEKLAEVGEGLQPLQLKVNADTGTLENIKKSVQGVGQNAQNAGQAFSAMGNALNQIEDPGAKVAGYIASAIGQTAAAFGTAQTQAATMGPWAWIAFAATGLATMIATITGIKNATSGYAEGGLITGPSYTGDAVPIMANAGEVVLNASQQENIAGQLESNAGGGQSARTTISGEQLVTVINNYGKRTGRGEILR